MISHQYFRGKTCFFLILPLLAMMVLLGCPKKVAGPTASFTATPGSGIRPLTVHFTDTSDAGSESITAWVWDFGDGGNSTDQNPSHSYTVAGSYTVSLTVTSSVGGDTASQADYIKTQQYYWFVKSGASGDGTSWDSAFGSIQAAVDAAAAEEGGEIWVAAGSYTGTADPVITMQSNIGIYGGFAGTESSRDDRSWEINVTTIDGEGARRCLIGADDATFDGFTVQNGYVTSPMYGGGMYNDHTSPTVANCVFRANHAKDGNGGAIFNEASSATLTNCTFSNNTAGYMGGAIFNEESSTTLTVLHL